MSLAHCILTILTGTLSAAALEQSLTPREWQEIQSASQRQRHAAARLADGRLEAYNPGQQWRTHFDSRGFTVKPDAGHWQWGLALEAFGWDGHLQPTGTGYLTASGNRVTSTRPGVEEWFVNDERGLEQGFTVPAPPRGTGQTLVFAMSVRGALRARLQGRAVHFTNTSGHSVLTFGGLKAWDADGRPLAAAFENAPGGLRYRVDVAGARYPVTVDPVAQQAYLKASNTDLGDSFGQAIAVSGDTLVVGAPLEGSNATGVDGDQTNNGALASGAAYVFIRTGSTWTQQAYLKASNTGAGDLFGRSVAISGDTIVIGAPVEASNATTIDGNGANNSALGAGAAYVFVRTGTNWTQQAYLKASNAGLADNFGQAVAVSGDTVIVGAPVEASNATGVGGNGANNSAPAAGAAYVFFRTGTNWTQQAYLKASNTAIGDAFGGSVAISGDLAVVGAIGEDSNATGVGGNAANNSALGSGAAYVFLRTGTNWAPDGYLKASNTNAGDIFGTSVAISGNTILVGAPGEASNATGVGGDQTNNSAPVAGAVYVFTRSGTWSQQAYLKASNTGLADAFGTTVALSGNAAVVGAVGESSDAVGINGDGLNDNSAASGAAYTFLRNGTAWAQQAYLKASNTGTGDIFGSAVGLSGNTVAVGARVEASNATGVGGNGANNGALGAGAAYAFTLPVTLSISAGSPQSAFVSAAFANALQALVVDENGNPVAGVTVSFTAPGSGASGTFPGGLLTTTAVTNSSGLATAPIFTANANIGGPYNINATANGATNTIAFSLTNLDPSVQVTVTTNLNGPTVSVDGGPPFTGSQTFLWTIGTSHTLATTTPQSFAGGLSRYIFQSWSDGGALSHAVIAPATATTFTANFSIQHQVTFLAVPTAGGTVLPATGFFNQNDVLNVAATANPNYAFAGFTGALLGLANPQPLTVTGPLTVTANFVPGGAYQVRYMSNLNLGDSVVNITNTGARGAGLAAGTSASTTGAICANVYAFSPDEQMVSCCSCPVTPNGLVSLSGRSDLISNTLTPAVPTSLVVKLVATLPAGGTCLGSAATVSVQNLAPGLAAWGTTVKTGITSVAETVETPFLPASLIIGGVQGIGELARLQQLCTFINANGSGFGICRSCRLGGLGADRQ